MPTAIYKVDAINRISKINPSKRKHMTFENFLEEEKVNPSLKKFNDMYRLEYALRQKMFGNKNQFEFYKNGIGYNTSSLKTKLLLSLPKLILICLWYYKQVVKKLKRFCFIAFK